MESKTCAKCSQNKALNEFVKNKSKQPGSWCRECYRSYVKQREYNKYSNRAEYLSAYQKNLRTTEKNHAFEKDYRQKYNASFDGTVTKLLSSVRSRAKKKGLSVEIDREWVKEHLEPMKCEATGLSLLLEVDNNVCHSAFRPSVDRIENDKGYTRENSRIVSVIFNKAKSDYTDVDLLKMANGLVKQSGGLK